MAGGGSPVDAYYYFLKYTMKQGILMGLYQFLIGMGWLSDDEATTEKVVFISEWIFSSWGDDSYYYKTSKLIWVFLFDDDVGVCSLSDATQCKIMKYYWMFIMTLNIVFTLPLSHVAATYDYGMGNYEKAATIIGWFTE